MSASDAVRSHVITVGEELLSGATVDGNAAWLGRRLGDLGAPVSGRATVGDRDEDIASAVRSAVARAEITVLTGGLGPTADDRTRTAVAAELGEPLAEDPELVAALEAHARARERSLTPELRSLALRPVSGRALPNPAGAAPGLAFRYPGDRSGWVILLPGVPREMRALFPQVEALLRETFGARLMPVVSRMIYTTGTPESILAPAVEAALGTDRSGVEVAYLPDLRGVDLRLTTRRAAGESERDVVARLDAVERRLDPVLKEARFDASSGDLAESVLAVLGRAGSCLAVAESCTGGMLGARLTARPGASRSFVGGVIAYADSVKRDRLGVPRDLLETDGAVSESVACAMASGVAEAFGADCGIGITGVAGPGGGSEAKPVGTVWIGWCVPASAAGPRVEARRYRFTGDREAVRIRATQAALHGLLQRLSDGG